MDIDSDVAVSIMVCVSFQGSLRAPLKGLGANIQGCFFS